jgi:hypothetical protein
MFVPITLWGARETQLEVIGIYISNTASTAATRLQKPF